ncbi:MAG TPA: hypothetical protein VE987_10130 [Polyangiaceae bacterium]|nr:hypothetical protein [Polyangiaceae bacterium]
MADVEIDRMRREILDELRPLLLDELAGDGWGRALVEVVRAPGGDAVVAGIEVEEIVGDEAHVDAVFGGDAARALLPVIARATEALCALEGVDLDSVRGGTFVRAGEGFAWMPGLVRAPSLRLDRERDALVASLRDKNERLRARFEADRLELDVEASRLRWRAGGRELGSARATLIGTFARGPRTWAWAWDNPSVPASAQRASAALTDALPERDLWEITSPSFHTDEPTAWALSALVCARAGGDGVQRMARPDGALFVLVRDVQGAEDERR